MTVVLGYKYSQTVSMLLQAERFMKRLLVCGVGLMSAVLVFGQTPRVQQRSAGPTPTPAAQRAVLDQYCVTCHNEKTKTAGLALDKLDLKIGRASCRERV